MDFQQMLLSLPGIDPTELMVVQTITREMTDNQKQQFFSIYQGRRKDSQTIMILTIVGFFGVAGIQRFMIGEVVMGVLFLFTGGFCGIGTIIDLVNNKKISNEFNQKQAAETAGMVMMMQGR